MAAGSDRVIDLLGSRDGVVTVYGDVHNGCIMRNTDHGLIECSFGPIGRSGGRGVIEGFGPQMKDFDGRPLEVKALYHKSHADPMLQKHAKGDPFYWNFLEMEFDPTKPDPEIGFRIRNMIDAPNETPRGGGGYEVTADHTGRKPRCLLPALNTLPNADIHITTIDGQPIRGTRSDSRGEIPKTPLTSVKVGMKVIVNVFDGRQSKSTVVKTV